MNKTVTIFMLFLLFQVQLFALNFVQKPKKLSAYLIASPQEIAVVKRNLLHEGFYILAVTPILPGQTVITITNEELKSTNSYMSTLQINVNLRDIRVQNPSYLGAAYLGKNYFYGKFQHTIIALENALGTLAEGNQQINFKDLGEYRFMHGLPKREDMLSIKRSANLLAHLSNPHSKHYIAYQLRLPNGSILVGHKLRNQTNDFLSTLGQEQNAHILPYESMINGNEVSIMNPKYYLALSLPRLTLHEFMQIASTPDRIYRNIKKAYE